MLLRDCRYDRGRIESLEMGQPERFTSMRKSSRNKCLDTGPSSEFVDISALLNTPEPSATISQLLEHQASLTTVTRDLRVQRHPVSSLSRYTPVFVHMHGLDSLSFLVAKAHGNHIFLVRRILVGFMRTSSVQRLSDDFAEP